MFWVNNDLSAAIWVMQIFARPKKSMSQGLGVVVCFSDNLGAPNKQQIGLTKSTSYFDMQEDTESQKIQKIR